MGRSRSCFRPRWKPERDPHYSGTLEIPAGGTNRYENVYDTLKREVFEETGLRVTGIKSDTRTKTYSPRDDEAFAFVPFCCEVKDVRWMKRSELQRIFEERPERIFTLQLGVLEYYFSRIER